MQLPHLKLPSVRRAPEAPPPTKRRRAVIAGAVAVGVVAAAAAAATSASAAEPDVAVTADSRASIVDLSGTVVGLDLVDVQVAETTAGVHTAGSAAAARQLTGEIAALTIDTSLLGSAVDSAPPSGPPDTGTGADLSGLMFVGVGAAGVSADARSDGVTCPAGGLMSASAAEVAGIRPCGHSPTTSSPSPPTGSPTPPSTPRPRTGPSPGPSCPTSDAASSRTSACRSLTSTPNSNG